jgi:hypothetical protein
MMLVLSVLFALVLSFYMSFSGWLFLTLVLRNKTVKPIVISLTSAAFATVAVCVFALFVPTGRTLDVSLATFTVIAAGGFGYLIGWLKLKQLVKTKTE